MGSSTAITWVCLHHLKVTDLQGILRPAHQEQIH